MIESVGTKRVDGAFTAIYPDALSEISVSPQDDADDLAVMVLAVEGRRDADDALREKKEELEASERRKGDLTDRKADETEL